jgi:ubiquinone/menaquinone biosynthesis C-methylase UbiE|tara:strand:+ start:176 stop:934 length:759 start_codon:yes stop_codon:yes gene_type:complete
MGKVRKPFQGVFNIIRFNWHFYVIAIALCIGLNGIQYFVDFPLKYFLEISSIILFSAIVISLFSSYYIYDFSGLYQFKWIKKNHHKDNILNINAGFDETSELIINRNSSSKVSVLDFYDPLKHTEVSIKRARKAFPPLAKTISIQTNRIPFEDNSIDKIYLILSAHEIRDKKEQIQFFTELNRVLTTPGKIFITEHLRDIPNLLAYNIGVFHFFSRSSWLNTFKNSHLKVSSELKNTPFISTFTLTKNGNSL